MISRELYKKIKKMNREEMDDYLSDVFNRGYNSGVDSITKEISDRIVAGIEKTKGIGEKRMKDLIDNISTEFTKK